MKMKKRRESWCLRKMVKVGNFFQGPKIRQRFYSDFMEKSKKMC